MPLNTLGFDPEDILDPVTKQPLGTEPIPTGIEEFDSQEEKPPEEHKKWKDHINQDYYKDLDATEQENFRRQYFEHRVAPQVTEDDQFNARMQFDVYSAQDVIGKQHKQSRFSSAGGSLARSFGKMVASLPKAVGEGAVNLANKFGDDPIWGNPEKITPEQTTSYKAGEAIEKWFDKFTVNPEYQDEFWTSDIPEGAGSMLGFIAGGAAGKIAEIPVLVTTMGLGAAATGVEGVEDYLSTLSDDEKADPEMRESAFNLNAVLGTSEGLPISRILDRIDGVTGGGVKRILKEGFKGGLEELTQEVLQSVGQNAIAAKLLAYDPDRSLLTGTKEAGEVGFTLGAILNTLAAMIGSRKTGRTRGPSEPSGEPALEGELLGPEEPDITLGQTGITGHIPQLAAPDGLQEAADTYRDALEQKAMPPPAQDTLAEPTAPEIGQTGVTGHITEKVDPETGHELIEGMPLKDAGIKLLSAPQEDRREQVSIGPTDERRAGNRRIDSDLRKKVDQMTPEERYQAVYVDQLTGLFNRRAFKALPWRNHLASVDLDNLKWVNEELGHSAGDEALLSAGRAVKEAIGESSTVDAYRIGGDEYIVQGDSVEEIDKVLNRANEILSDIVLENKGVTKKGIDLTWGVATHKEVADELMEKRKVEREISGERAGRGEEPAGVTRTLEAQKELEERQKKLSESKGLEVDSSGAKPSAPESSVDGPRISPESLADLSKTEPFKSKGFSGFDIPTQGLVMDAVLMSVSDLKVAKSIVSSIPVDVVNDLGGSEAAANTLLNNPSMFKDMLTTDGGTFIPAAIDIANSYMRGIAGLTAEVVPVSGDVTGGGVEADTALGTIADRQDVPPVQDVELEAGAAPTAPALSNLAQEEEQSKDVANEQKSKQEAADAIARDRKADTPADAVRNIDETGCPK